MTPRAVVSTRRLRVISDAAGLSPEASPEAAGAEGKPAGGGSLGVLSIHLDGRVCRVGCEFCYLGQRTDDATSGAALDLGLVERALERLHYDEVAVAVSEPVGQVRPVLDVIRRAAGRRKVSVTTTLQIARTRGLLDDIDRVNLSVDPRKGRISTRTISRVAATLRDGGTEVVLIVSLTTPEFAARLIDGGLLAELVDLPSVDKVALNALKPPPQWCGREFWLRSLARLAPLLERSLDRRLFLDCWVAARLLNLGGCPARADLTPALSSTTIGNSSGLAFRSCVYQPAADFVVSDADELAARLDGFVAPATCPFPIP